MKSNEYDSTFVRELTEEEMIMYEGGIAPIVKEVIKIVVKCVVAEVIADWDNFKRGFMYEPEIPR